MNGDVQFYSDRREIIDPPDNLFEENIMASPTVANKVEENVSLGNSIDTLHANIDSLFEEIDNLDGYLGPISTAQVPATEGVAASPAEGVIHIDSLNSGIQRIRDARDRIIDIKERAKV